MSGISQKKKNILIVIVVLLTIFLIWLVIVAYDNKIKRIEKKLEQKPVSKNIKAKNQN